MLILVMNNSFLLHYLKRKFIDKPIVTGLFAVLLVTAYVLDKFNILSLSGYSSLAIINLINNPIYILIPFLILLIVYP